MAQGIGELYGVVAGSMVQERRLEVLAHNLANVATVGFKADIPIFEVVPVPPPPASMIPVMSPSTALTPTPSLAGVYPTFAGIRTDMSQGELLNTGNSLDLAINGKGWFAVQTDQGIRYTRKGNFTLNNQGQLATQDGWLVVGNRGPITIRGNDIRIDPRGTITVDEQEVDQLNIVTAPSDDAFEKEEGVLFALKPGIQPGGADAAMDVKQGFLERSNISPFRGMVELVNVMRANESYQKVLQTFSDITSRAINDVGRLR